MSETIAIRMRSTVSRVRAMRVVAPVALAALVSELGVRLLAPRDRLAASAPAPLERFFSGEEVRRGARYTRGQAVLGIGGTVLDAALLAALTRRPRLPGRRLSPILGGSVDGAAISLMSTAAGLPLAALRRRRAL